MSKSGQSSCGNTIMRRMFIRNDRIKDVFHHSAMINGILKAENMHNVQHHYKEMVGFLQFGEVSNFSCEVCGTRIGIVTPCMVGNKCKWVWIGFDPSKLIYECSQGNAFFQKIPLHELFFLRCHLIQHKIQTALQHYKKSRKGLNGLKSLSSSFCFLFLLQTFHLSLHSFVHFA